MGEHSSKSKKRKKYVDDTSTSSGSASPSSSSSESDESSKKRHKSSRRRRHRDESRRSSDRSSRREREKMRREKKKKDRRDRKRKLRSEGKKMVSDSASEADSGNSSDRPRKSDDNPEDVVKLILSKFPGVSSDLEQLLKMIDDGQAVDIRGLSEKSLVRYLKKLFLSLNLKEKDDLVFLLPSNVRLTLDVVGPFVRCIEQKQDHFPPEERYDANILPPDSKMKDETYNNTSMPFGPTPQEDSASSRKKVIGPEMPSAELLAAAAKLTEAEAELREAELNEDVGDFIGPPPPAIVKEAESANEAERFEEVTRIMAVEGDIPYDIVGVNRNMAEGNIKKRYWKLSLMVHPDKCSHPQAQEAFVKLNKAYKDLQDPDKRKAMDDKIKLKEEQDSLKAEMKEMRDAAHWRRLQGISMEGDDILLAEMDVKVDPKRDEWMTKLPPERKAGAPPTQSTQFSRTNKDGRGDTSAWTDTPSDRAQKAKINYLEAYSKAAELALNVEERTKMETERKLVEEYNKAKRPKSLVEMHHESAKSKVKKKKKKKQGEGGSTEEWEGQHPWKPWDREKDLTAGRLNVKLDPDNMAQGLSSRFSSSSFQKSFL